MGLDAVLNAIRREVTNAINAAQIPQQGQVIKGWPTAPQLVEILGQPTSEWQVSIYPLPSRPGTRWIDEDLGSTPPIVYLIGSVSGNVLTLTGAGVPAIDATTDVNIHAFIKGVDADVYAVGSPGDPPATTAQSVANAVNDLAISGVTATANANTVVLSGAVWQSVNIGGTGTIMTEATRLRRMVQVTAWTTGDPTSPNGIDSTLRFAILDAILGNLGTRRRHFIATDDGVQVYIKSHGDTADDDSQSSYSLYASFIFFDIEYSVPTITPATQIGVAIPTTTVVAGALTQSTTDFIGGP